MGRSAAAWGVRCGYQLMLYLCHRSPLPPTIQQSTPTPEQHSVTKHTHEACIFFKSNKSPRMHTHREARHTQTRVPLKRGTQGFAPRPSAPAGFWGWGRRVCVLKFPQNSSAEPTRRLVEASRIDCTLGGSSNWSSGTEGRATPALVAPRRAPHRAPHRAHLRTETRASHDAKILSRAGSGGRDGPRVPL